MTIDRRGDISQALLEIRDRFGDAVSVKIKAKHLSKFGRNDEVGTSSTTLMTLPTGVADETYVDDNLITSISSSNVANDQTVTIEGHTVDGNGDFSFTVQEAILDGQNIVSLETPLARATRFYNSSGTEFLGQVYIFETDTVTGGVPDTDSKVHAMTRNNQQQTEKASTTLSSTDYWLITSVWIAVIEKSTAFADVELDIREKGGVFRARRLMAAASDGGTVQVNYDPPLIVRPNSDIRLHAVAGAANTSVIGQIHGYLATKLQDAQRVRP